MRKFLLSLLAIASTVLMLSSLPGQGHIRAQQAVEKFRRTQGARAVPDEYIVVLNEGVAAADVDSLATQLARKHRGRIKHTYTSAIKGFSARLTEAQALALSENPLVAFVEENGQVSVNDTQFNAPWGLDRIDQRFLPLNGTYVHNSPFGSGVNVYVADTGIFTAHTQFQGRALATFDAVQDGQPFAQDCYGHGTHVAGTIGGSTYGVAKQVTLHSVRVLGCDGFGTWQDVIEGVDFVKQQQQAFGGRRVLNMSLGGGRNDAADAAVKSADKAGVCVVVSAGNSNDDATNYTPAHIDRLLTIAATGINAARAGFSNFGAEVDLFAPGVDIPSAWPNFAAIPGCTLTSSTPNASTAICSGTSMAAPHVAGAAARVWALNPSFLQGDVDDAIKNNATTGVVGNPGPGSPNRLLYTGNF